MHIITDTSTVRGGWWWASSSSVWTSSSSGWGGACWSTFCTVTASSAACEGVRTHWTILCLWKNTSPGRLGDTCIAWGGREWGGSATWTALGGEGSFGSTFLTRKACSADWDEERTPCALLSLRASSQQHPPVGWEDTLQYLEGVEEHSEGGGGVIIMTL